MGFKDTFFRNEIKEILFYVFLGTLTAIIIPILIGFSFLAFEESFVRGNSLQFGDLLVTFMIYYIFTVATFALVIFPIGAMIMLKKGQHPATQEKPSFFSLFSVSYIFSPENGMFYRMFESVGLSGKRNPMRWSFSFLRVIAVSILVFWALGIAQIAFPNLQVVGVPQLQAQQVTVASDVAFVSLIPAWSETMTILFLFFLILGGISWFVSKNVKDKSSAMFTYFALAIIIGCSIIALLWSGLHRIVYGGSEVAILSTLIFGFIGSFLTLASGTFIPFWIWHIFNNVYARLSQLVPANEDIIFISVILYAIFAFGYIFLEVWLYRNRKRSGASIDESF
jgi:fumarate reductase subunit D